MGRNLCVSFLMIGLSALSFRTSKAFVQATPSLADPGFERLQASKGSRWKPFELGFTTDIQAPHGGKVALRCVNEQPTDARGAVYALELGQKTPAPLIVTGWSRAKEVSGSADSDYALYVDLDYTDGTHLWGQTAVFDTGTHDWQKKRVLIVPSQPIQRASIYALFRHHTGTAWFDDVSAVALKADHLFDHQAIAPPMLSAGLREGWFARDVAANSPILPLTKDGAERLHLRFDLEHSVQNGIIVGKLEDTTGKPRAITVYYVERFDAKGAVWWEDIRRSRKVRAGEECANLTHSSAGAVESHSLYPFGCVTNGRKGIGLGIPPTLGPRIARIGYHAGSGLLYLAMDLALTPVNPANRAPSGHGAAKVGVARLTVDPAWGFRSAVDDFYRLFPEFYRRPTQAGGIWMPFTNPASVEGVKDFGFAFHEGDNSVESDDALGILSFRYTEPMTYWMPMPVSVPRTYDAAMEMIRSHATGMDAEKRRWAEAVLTSGSRDAQGRFNVEFRNEPWANGAVFALNPNPALKAPAGQTTKAALNYTKEYADKAYGPTAKGKLDGEYLDSLEGWADVLDYREESLRDSPYAPTFAPDTFRPVLPTWFSVYAETDFMRRDLHRRGKLLFANSTPWHIYAFAPLLDVMGTETNWMNGKQWQPESDAIMCYRRTLSDRKPYLLLQNTDFDAIGPYVERYFQRSMFYGVFPSFFSPNAANNPYWDSPKWYNRDRALFKKYIPIIQRLSKAGWEPLTEARADKETVYVERFGSRYLTVMNESEKQAEVTLKLDPSFFQRRLYNAKGLALRSLLDGKRYPVRMPSGKGVFSLQPQESLALELVPDSAND